MKKVNNSAIRRLPRYYRELKKWQKNKRLFASTRELSEILGVHETQIRKDLAITGHRGIPKKGHRIDTLLKAIEKFLRWDDDNSAFIVGVGNIGTALIKHKQYENSGLKIVAAFDSNPAKIGKSINSVEVLPMDKLGNLIERMHIHIGIITTPPHAAQKIANTMVKSGIMGIWNFTSEQIIVPENIILENVDLYYGLSVLSHRVSQKLKNK